MYVLLYIQSGYRRPPTFALQQQKGSQITIVKSRQSKCQLFHSFRQDQAKTKSTAGIPAHINKHVHTYTYTGFRGGNLRAALPAFPQIEQMPCTTPGEEKERKQSKQQKCPAFVLSRRARHRDRDARNGWMGGLQKLITFFSGWAGLQKLITDLDRFYPYKGGVQVSIYIGLNK